MKMRAASAVGLCATMVAAALVGLAPTVPPAQASETSTKQMRLWYDAPAADSNTGWVDQSLPLGNGYMGVNVFGGTTTERLQITENSLMDGPADGTGGTNNFAEVYLDFAHNAATGYTRELSLDDSTATVAYTHNGVGYTREYFSSYPDKVTAVRLTASTPGGLDFTLRPTVPYETAYRTAPGDGRGKSGTVVASGDTITLSGVMEYYNLQFEGQFKVIPTGGSMQATTDAGGDNGKITVTDADSAIVLIAVGTNYEPNPQVITKWAGQEKLVGFAHPHAKVSGYIAAAAAKSWSQLLAAHQADYTELYDRASLDLGGVEPSMPTDDLIDSYRAGTASTYLEELLFQYGRYLLICSSRSGTLPPNLQGVWNVYQDPPWTGGYWHNVNLQMNYWPAFNTNLAELFDSYIEYSKTYMPRQKSYATQYVNQYNPSQLDPGGDNGWAFGNSSYALRGSPKSVHTGFGSGAWVAQLFWDYYDFTRDQQLLSDTVYPALYGQSNFLSRFIQPVDGKLLANPSSSPENMHGGAYPQHPGTTFDQQMIYENHRNTLAAAQILGRNDSRLATFQSQLPLLDPIKIGRSGQIKEYRQEDSYSDIGDPSHRHTSHLLGQYPGQLINSSTPAWNDAVKTTLTKRNNTNAGWALTQRMGHWARAQEGDKAYGQYQSWLKIHVLHNLFASVYPTASNKLFQVEANFGATAGIAEMLLQGHEEVVAPLAALPSTWSTGSYDGLTARGNFEVDADWASGQATRFEVTSKSGGTLKLRYPQVGSAVVKTAGGATVSYTVEQGGEQISFPTTAGTTYVVTSIPTTTKVAPPTNLTVGSDPTDQVNLNWTASADATSYSVYKALGDAPTYQLVASNVTGTSYSYTDTSLRAHDQTTFRVVANGAGGRQSPGPTVVRTLPNLALGRTATQSSTYTTGAASRAADGNTNGAWSGGSLSHTNLESQPWWQVDLGSSKAIGEIGVWNRTDSCCASRLGDYYVLVSDTPFTGTLSEILAQPGVTAYHRTAAPSPRSYVQVGRKARYVRVQLTGSNYLTLAEVQVLPVATSLALGKPATQSSVNYGAVASRAVDGNTNGVFSANSVTHTTTSSQPWWQVDLGASTPIGDIAVWNRTDCCTTRLGDYYVLVSDTPITGATLTEALATPGVRAYHQTTAPAPSTRIPVGGTGRYVRVQLTGSDALALAEVQVFRT